MNDVDIESVHVYPHTELMERILFYIKMVITDNVQIFILQAINILMVSHSQCSENCKPSPMLFFHCKAKLPPVLLLTCHKVCIFSTDGRTTSRSTDPYPYHMYHHITIYYSYHYTTGK